MFKNLQLYHNPKTWKPDAVLLFDVSSNIRREKQEMVHGLKGDAIKVITRSGAVIIAENKKGVRFAIHETKIQQTK